MKAVISKEEDSVALLLALEVKEHEMAARFRQQSEAQEHITHEVFRGVRYVVVQWLQEQGFKVTRG